MGVQRLLKIFTFFVFLASIPTWAQSYFCKHVDIRDGLSQPSVTCILSDSQGAVWIGTRFGLNKYRSNHVSTERTDYVHSLFLDSRDNLWAGTENGLYLKGPGQDDFTQMAGLTTVHCAVEAEAGVYFGSSEGIHYYSNATGEFVGDYVPIENAFVVRILPLDHGRILIVDRGLGLMVFSPENKSLERVLVPGVEQSIIMDACFFDGSLYLAVYNRGLVVVNIARKEVVREYTTLNSGLSFDIILSLLEIDGQLWMGTDGGGICILGKDRVICRLEEMSSGSFTCLYHDFRGTIWAGTVRNGAFSLKTTYIRQFPLSNEVVNSLWRAADGVVWIGTDGGGVNACYPDGTVESGYPGQEGVKVHSLTEFDSNRLILSVYSQGLQLFDKKSGKRTPFLIVDKTVNAQECGSGGSPNLYAIQGGKILILAIRAFLYDVSGRRFHRFNVGKEWLDVSEMTLFGEDPDGFRYAFSQGGIFKIDVQALDIERVFRFSGEQTVNCATLSADGTFWVGTNRGLFSLKKGGNDLEPFVTNQFSRVTQLKAWNEGRLWIAADNMLFSMDRDSHIEILDESDGFPANEVLASSISNTFNDQAVYFGGTGGFVEILSRAASRENHSLELDLYEVIASGKRLSCKTGGKVTIPWNYGSLFVGVNLNGIDPFQKEMYRFEVDGGGSLSVTETYEDVIQLPGLTDGTYRINASYLQRDGSWSAPVRMLDIIVLPPWYRSWWFYTIILVLVTLLVTYAVYRYNERTQQNLAHTLSRWVETSVEGGGTPRKSALGQEEKDLLGRLNSYVEEHMSDNNLNVAEIARETAMSRASLYSKVKSITGMGVAQYVEDLRIRRACHLLKETRKSVAEISEEVGFSTPNYFSMRFKQTVGISPLTFRKNSQ